MIRNIVLASKALKTHTHTHCNNINSEINTELEKTNYNRFYLDPMTAQPFSTVKKSAHRKNAPWTNWMGRTQQHLDKKPNEDHLPHSIYTKVCTSLKTDFHCQQQKPKTAFFFKFSDSFACFATAVLLFVHHIVNYIQDIGIESARQDGRKHATFQWFKQKNRIQYVKLMKCCCSKSMQCKLPVFFSYVLSKLAFNESDYSYVDSSLVEHIPSPTGGKWFSPNVGVLANLIKRNPEPEPQLECDLNSGNVLFFLLVKNTITRASSLLET